MLKLKRLLVALLSVAFAFSVMAFVVTANATTDDVLIGDVAEVRLALDDQGRNGIRFIGYVKDSIELDENTFAGIEVSREDVAGVLDIKANSFDATGNLAKDGYKRFNAVVHNIPEEFYGEKLTAKAYISRDGIKEYSSETVSKSIAEVASAELASGEVTLPEEIDGYNAYVDGANAKVYVNGTELSAEGENNFDIVGGDTLTVTADGDLTPIVSKTVAENHNAHGVKNLVVEGNEVTAQNTKPVTSTVSVSLGSKTYTFNVDVGVWYEDIADEYVLSNFEQERSAYSAQVGVVAYNSNYPDGIYTGDIRISHISAESEEGQAIGATSGVLKVDSSNYGEFVYHFETPLKVSEINGIYIKYKMDAGLDVSGGKDGMHVYTNGCVKTLELGTDSSRNHVAGNGDWAIVNFTKYDLTDYFGYTEDSVIEKFVFEFILSGGTVYYVDEIGLIENAFEDWTDNDIADGVFMDFDEKDYLNSVETFKDTDEAPDRNNAGHVYHLSGDALVNELGEDHGANGGVLKLKAENTYSTVRLHFQKPIPRTQISGFTIRMRVPFTKAAQLMFRLPGTAKGDRAAWIFSHANGGSQYRTKYGGVQLGDHAANEWIDVNFTLSCMISNFWGDWTGVPEVLEYIDVRVNATMCIGDWYFDEITVMNRAEDGYLIDFNEKIDLNSVNGHTSWWTGDAPFSIETGIGGEATTTALALNSNCQNNFGIIPENTVNGKNVSKIIVRVYAPKTELSTGSSKYAGFRLSVNSSTGIATAGIHNFTTEVYTNTAGLSTLVPSASCFLIERGKWVDVEVDVAGKLSDKNIDLIAFHRSSYSAYSCAIPEDDGAWYIDSIRYVLAD